MSTLEKVEKHALKEFRKEFWDSFPYHNLVHTLSVVEMCRQISNALDLSERQKEILEIAAWFHDLGYTHSYTEHEKESKGMARNFLENENFAPQDILLVEEIIESTRVDYTNQKNILEEIMFDADRNSIGRSDFLEQGNQLREEWKYHGFALFSDEGWYALQVRYLENTLFRTSYSKEMYEIQRLRNLEEAKINYNIISGS